MTAAPKPTDIARQALLRLAQRKVPPTPDNFRLVYEEISGHPSEGGAAGLPDVLDKVLQQAGQRRPRYLKTARSLAEAMAKQDWSAVEALLRELLPLGGGASWPAVIRNLVRQLEASHKGLTPSKKKEGLERVLINFEHAPDLLPEKIQALVASWGAGVQPEGVDTGALAEPAPSPPAAAGPAGAWRDLLIQTLELGLLSQLRYLPELARKAEALLEQARRAHSGEDIARLAQAFRPFWYQLEIHSDGQYRLHEELLQVLRLLADNMGELVADDAWLQGQAQMVQEILHRPLDIEMLYDAESGLKELVFKQGQIRHGIAEARETLKQMAASFVERLAAMAASTGNYQEKIAAYQEEIGATRDIVELNRVLDRLMADTRTMQLDALRSHEQLQETQQKVAAAEQRIRELTAELEQASELMHRDFLTAALNRRGMQEALEREFARADRRHAALSLALLDIDHFKKLNDSLGHAAGDAALAHLAQVTRQALRPDDVLARYGGEEFLILLPETGRDQATQIMTRLQRELTRNFFLHQNERVLITFSAGVAERRAEEPPEAVIRRADQALYQAKHSGRNRVVAAE